VRKTFFIELEEGRGGKGKRFKGGLRPVGVTAEDVKKDAKTSERGLEGTQCLEPEGRRPRSFGLRAQP